MGLTAIKRKYILKLNLEYFRFENNHVSYTTKKGRIQPFVHKTRHLKSKTRHEKRFSFTRYKNSL